jgi:hypothetical protein
MTITTQFTVGDTIWYVSSQTRLPVTSTVASIQINITNTTSIDYRITENGILIVVNSINAFASQEDLAASFNPAP